MKLEPSSKVIKLVEGLISQLTDTVSPSRSDALPSSIKSEVSFETSIVSPLREPAFVRVGLFGLPTVGALEAGLVETEFSELSSLLLFAISTAIASAPSVSFSLARTSISKVKVVS